MCLILSTGLKKNIYIFKTKYIFMNWIEKILKIMKEKEGLGKLTDKQLMRMKKVLSA